MSGDTVRRSARIRYEQQEHGKLAAMLGSEDLALDWESMTIELRLSPRQAQDVLALMCAAWQQGRERQKRDQEGWAPLHLEDCAQLKADFWDVEDCMTECPRRNYVLASLAVKKLARRP